MLAVLLLSIAAFTVPILIERILLYDEYGFSKNTTLTHFVLPGVWSAVTLLVIALIVWTRVAGDLDVVWYRWSRSEVIKATLLIITAPLVYFPTALLMHKLGLPLKEDLYSWVDQRGLAFFITLTVFITIIGPILEELFWRVYVFSTLQHIFGGLIALLGQAVIFGIIHFRPFGGFVPVFFFGLITGAWRWRRKTLVPIILAHIVLNSLWCVARWPDWLDFTRVRTTHDYVAEFIELSKPPGYDPNDDARQDYAKADQLIVEFSEELEQVRKRYPTQWSREQRDQVEAWLVSNKEALDLIEKATQKPYYWVEYERQNERMPPLTKVLDKMRVFIFTLCMRATLRITQGQYDQGFSDIETCYRLGRHLATNKELICTLVGNASRNWALQTTRMILAHEKINGPLLNDLHRRFEEFTENDSFGFDFTAEKLFALDVIQCIFTDGGQGGGHIPRCFLKQRSFPRGEYETGIPFLSLDAESDANRWRKLRRNRTTEQVETYYDLCERVCSQPPWRYRSSSSMRMRIEMFQKQNPLIELYSPGIERLVSIAGRARVERDATIAILAILRYKHDKTKLPDTLLELVDAGYLKGIPEDSFYNGPLIYRCTDDDFILYSFGADFDDDGGTPSKWGYGEKGGDQVFWPVQESTEDSESIAETKTR